MDHLCGNLQILEHKKKIDNLLEKREEEKEKLKKAEEDLEVKKSEAEESVKEAKEQAEQAIQERDQAIRERDDARAIADEKTVSNELLMRQMASMEADVQAYKELQKEVERLRQKLIEAELVKEKAVMDRERELRDHYEKRIIELSGKLN